VRPPGTALVYTVHGFHFQAEAKNHRLAGRVYQSLEGLVARRADITVVLTAEDRVAAVELLHIPHGKVRLIPGIGVDCQRYRLAQAESVAERKRLRRELSLPEDAYVLLVVGELSSNKRHSDIIRAIERLGARYFLVIAGEGPELESVQRLVQRLGIQDQIRLLGFRIDIPNLLAAVDLLVSASEREGLPRNILEAQAAGVPVVGSDVRGTRDLLDDGRGIVFELGSVEALAHAVSEVSDSASLARELTTKATAAIDTTYSEERILGQYRKLYAELSEP
jgi:glycosyltransferase involved in cell wall biosynthesis